MKATVERTPESEAVLTVTLEWAELERAAERAYKRLAQKYTVPGFRKGHAPRSMLERMLGKDTIYHEGLEDLVESSYRDAIREHDVTPVAQPTVDMPPMEQGQPYTYTAHVPILTPPTLGDYRAIRVPASTTTVTEDEVDHALEHMREDAVEWRPVERAARVDDQVTVDLKLTVDDKVVSNYSNHEFVLAVERPGIFAGLDDHLVGMSEGQSAEFDTTIPEDYANTTLAGKTGHYEISVKAVKERILPELDDEFAKTMGDYDSLAGLRTAVREQLERQKETEARRDLREQVVKAAADPAEVVIHPAMVSDEVDAMLRETSRVLGQNRLTLQQYLEIMKKSEDEYRTELEPEARERVKRDLVLTAVADAEGIEVSDQELAEWVQVLNALGGRPIRLQDLSAAQRASIGSRLRRDKALNRLVEIATEGEHGHEQESTPGSEPAGETGGAAEAQSPAAAGTTPAQAQSATQGEPASSGAEMEPTFRGAQQAARMGAELASATEPRATDVSGEGGDATARRSAEREPEQPQMPKSSETQALSESGTEVPKSGA